MSNVSGLTSQFKRIPRLHGFEVASKRMKGVKNLIANTKPHWVTRTFTLCTIFLTNERDAHT